MIDDGSTAQRLLHDPLVQRIATETAEHTALASMVRHPESPLPHLGTVDLVATRYGEIGGQRPDGTTYEDLAAAVIAVRRQNQQ